MAHNEEELESIKNMTDEEHEEVLKRANEALARLEKVRSKSPLMLAGMSAVVPGAKGPKFDQGLKLIEDLVEAMVEGILECTTKDETKSFLLGVDMGFTMYEGVVDAFGGHDDEPDDQEEDAE